MRIFSSGYILNSEDIQKILPKLDSENSRRELEKLTNRKFRTKEVFLSILTKTLGETESKKFQEILINKLTLLNRPNISFLKYRNLAFIISSVALIASIGMIFMKGFRYGIDFRGGSVVQVQFLKQKPPLREIRELFQGEYNAEVSVTTFGEEESNEVLLYISQEIFDTAESSRNQQTGILEEMDISDEVEKTLEKKFSKSDIRIRRVETVGPKVGASLKEKAYQAVLYALIGILAYIWIRFKWHYGIGAVAALFHDVLITLGIFAFMQKEITLTIIAALLTIVGYSLNDTIVVFDRIRENIAKLPKKDLFSVVNISVNESLSRTILTSVTTFLVVLALFFLGGDIIHDFSFALLIGLVVGTYSSVFVASPVMVLLNRSIQKEKT